MERAKISIIVPVYNVDKYLERCVDSLLKQTYKNLEIILVDDESPDSCPQICDQYKQKDRRIIVIHKKNGGAASARNMGLDVAKGEYIGFVDSDDYVSEEYINNLYQDLSREKADISVCSFYNLYKDHKEIVTNENIGIYDSKEYLELFLKDWKCGLIWNKLFKAKLIQKVRFSEGHIIDDEFFTYKAVMQCNRIVVGNEPFYYYRMRASGVMSQGKVKKMLNDRIEYIQERFQLVTKYYPSLYRLYLENLADNLIRFRREAVLYSDLYLKMKKIQKNYLREILLGPISWRLKYAYLHSMIVHTKSLEPTIMSQKNYQNYYE